MHGFFAASGAYGVRFVRLAVIAGLIYWWLFAYVHPWLFDTQFDNLTRGMNTERAAFLVRAIFYVFFGGVLLAVNLVVDYTKVRIVVEDRRSAIGAIAAAVRFIRTHLRQVLALYALNSLTFLVLIAVWALIAPGVGGAGLSMWAGFVVAQLYIVARLLLKAAVHRLPDRALPGEPRARVLRICAGSRMAGLSGGGSDRFVTTIGIAEVTSVPFSGRVTRGKRHGDSHLVLAVTALEPALAPATGEARIQALP